MKKFINIISALALVFTVAGCTTANDYGHKRHNDNEYQDTYVKHGKTACHEKKYYNNRSDKMYSKMFTRNNHGEASEIGYVKFYDIDQGVKMVVNVDHLRDGVDYTTKIYQCKDAKCMNPDTCCRETTMALEMPLTRKNKMSPKLQETFIIKNVNAKQLQGATIFFERDRGYRAAWGFID
ncbi:MAG: hypothetical protein ACLRFM_04260 [Alphaproteobacteria bacterium]